MHPYRARRGRYREEAVNLLGWRHGWRRIGKYRDRRLDGFPSMLPCMLALLALVLALALSLPGLRQRSIQPL